MNKLLKECVLHYVKAMRSQHLLHRHFFVRYFESGYHIRLRLLVPGDEKDKWKNELEHYFNGFLAGHDASDRESPDKNFIRYDTYVPELERYGGSAVITFAEQQFEASSGFVLELLEKTGSEPSLPVAIKLNMALLMGMKYTLPQMIQICQAFVYEWLPVLYDRTKDQRAQKEFFLSRFDKQFHEYEDDLVPAVDSVLNELTMAPANDELLASYLRSCQDIHERYQSCGVDLLLRQDIARSFMHMNHNRLGIRNLDEAYAIYLLFRSLEMLRANG